MEKTDLQLIEESIYLTQGRASFNVLVERHAKSVYFFIFRLVGNKDDSEDITQETFIKAWQKLSKFDTDLNFKTWLFSIARNTAIDKLRKKKSINFSSLDTESDEENFDFEASLVDKEPLPDEVFLQKESEENLKKALAQLSDNQRLIIHLHISEDLTFEEIAEIIDRPMNTVKSQYGRSLKKLRGIL